MEVHKGLHIGGQTSKTIKSLLVGGVEVFDETIIAIEFHEYFSNVAGN